MSERSLAPVPGDAIAIVGMACRYPDADSPEELWRNVLAGRRAFRRMPPERLRLEDYLRPDRSDPDSIYTPYVAVLEGYEFDRARFRVSGSAYRAADLAHWLALDVAAASLTDAGFAGGEGLPRETTGVILGNTLTGEFSRANTLRLRWPYVRRVVEAGLGDRGWTAAERREFLTQLETRYKAPFPEVGEETLAGGLSNTIAGRICNHFDLKGGGYTVDGACASSLLAVTTACTSLVAGDLDVAIAGGVDLSLDPFELVGFARTGALAPELMRIYDARSAGFWPGEGCGFLVLMRAADARKRDLRVHALVRGWGVASDGSGGLTRPEAEGQLLALRRAYRRAGYGADSVVYFEGHGTGTIVGDTVELEVLSRARREGAPVNDSTGTAAAIGSIKANIGHTKAAAGVAGVLKAVLALHHQIQPSTTGCFDPHPALAGAAVRVLGDAEPWPADRPLRASVSAMGFGGIDTHVTLEGVAPARRGALDPEERRLISTPQDSELFLFGAESAAELKSRVEHVRGYAGRISFAEMADLAAALIGVLPDSPRVRAAVVAGDPAQLEERLSALMGALDLPQPAGLDPQGGIFMGVDQGRPRIGFLFPGQGSPSHRDGGLWRRRFDFARLLYDGANLPVEGDPRFTAVAQPAIVTASLAGLAALDALGIAAGVAVGHSLGELTAWHWAGSLDGPALIRLAAVRGHAMAALRGPEGAMASLALGADETAALIAGGGTVIAGLNGPRQTVISGAADAVAAAIEKARTRGVAAVRLPVSHAFHSPLVAATATALNDHLAREPLGRLGRPVFSTIAGERLEPATDLRDLLLRQLVSPVRFAQALAAADAQVELWLEVGPGRTLSGLAASQARAPAIALDAGSASVAGLLCAAGAAWSLGSPLRTRALLAGRFVKPFDLDWRPRFFVNPCELAPLPEAGDETPAPVLAASNGASAGVGESEPGAGRTDAAGETGDALEIVRQLVAERAELPVAAVEPDHRLLGDLHLNSIVVGQLAAEAARRLGLPAPTDPTAYAGATVAELARALEELRATRGTGAPEPPPPVPAGVDAWVRPFTIRWVERPAPGRPRATGPGAWRVLGPPEHALVAPLAEEFARRAIGQGVVVCLPAEPDERHIALLLEGERAVWPARSTSRFVVVQSGGGGGGFARSLHLESPETVTCLVDVPVDHPGAAAWVADEALAACGFHEARYDSDGTRHEPVIALRADPPPAPPALGPADVLLVTGGGKGIAAECALALARECGLRLGLIGRSHPDEDPVLAGNLARIAACGATFRYARADVTDAADLMSAVSQIEGALGPVTAVLHGAGANAPRPLSALDEDAFRRTVEPKLAGARNLLAALDASRLKLFVAFGSIIARTGLRGEADYAAANEWLAMWVSRLKARHPHCNWLCVEWSVWSGVGMGERLGRLDALARDGITPIPPEAGIAMLRHLVDRPGAESAVVVAGRFGPPPTVSLEEEGLPLLRFLEQPRVHYPGIELVADSELGPDSDPFLADHVLQGESLLPAVIGLEAMAQAATALAGVAKPPVFEAVEFMRPITVRRAGSETLRTVALVREPGIIELALRCASTGFQVDHFRARCRVDAVAQKNEDRLALAGDYLMDGLLALDPGRDLYGSALFQSGRFQRLSGYRWLRATECQAEIAADGAVPWFGTYLSSTLVLGDPGSRDAAIHALQACIPHRTLLPVAVERIECARLPGERPLTVRASERLHEEDRFVYDLEIAEQDGTMLERWTGLTLQAVGPTRAPATWARSLLAPYFERRIGELVPGGRIGVSVEEPGRGRSGADTDRAISLSLGKTARVMRRPDGRPELPCEPQVAISAAHAGSLVVAISGPGPLGCDVELVVERTEADWQALLGAERFALAERVAREAGESPAAARTRLWAAWECVRKAGAMSETPLRLRSVSPDGWVVLEAGPRALPTFVASVGPEGHATAFAVLAGSLDAGL